MNDPAPGKPDKPPSPPPPARYGRSMLGWVIVIVAGLMAMTMMTRGFESRRDISTVDFWRYVENGQVEGELLVRKDSIEGTNPTGTPDLKPGQARKFRVSYSYLAEDSFDLRLRAALEKRGNPAKPVYKMESWWDRLLPEVLLLGLVILAVWFLLLRRMPAGGGGGFLGSFGRSRHRVFTKEITQVRFGDVAGIEEAKEEVAEIVEFLKNPRKFQRLGGRVPRGVLLVGEPGCGKTLLAKAIAGEADVPFFCISGSDFVEMFVGVGASRVRDLFKQAKESSPCIIFLDEIDAVGRRRGLGFNGGGHDEREQTLNAILVEMDGFDTSDQVIVIAATNRSDILDPALTRPGRFDRQVHVPLPDLQGRCEILKIYANKVKVGPDVDLHRLARGTPMFSGADLAALVNEAAISATMANKNFIEQADLEEARDKVRWGRARKSRVIDEKEKEFTAYHEAGHALAQLLTPGADPLHKVSIIPRGPMGGATFSLPEKDRYLYTRSYCKGLLCVSLGGRVAEELFCHDVSSGAQSDLSVVTEIARRMVLDWGMSERVGLVSYADEPRRGLLPEMGGKDYSERTAEVVDAEIRVFIDEAYAATRKLLSEHGDPVRRLAEALLKFETLSLEEVQQIVEGKDLAKPTVSDLLQREQARTPRPAPGAPQPPPIAAPPLPEPG